MILPVYTHNHNNMIIVRIIIIMIIISVINKYCIIIMIVLSNIAELTRPVLYRTVCRLTVIINYYEQFSARRYSSYCKSTTKLKKPDGFVMNGTVRTVKPYRTTQKAGRPYRVGTDK